MDRGPILSSNIVGVGETQKDIAEYIRKIFDNILIEEFNCKATRSNSIMCSSYNIAYNYGKCPYVIFPVDSFSYTWFKKQVRSYILFHIEESYEDMITEFDYKSTHDYFFDNKFYEEMPFLLQEKIKYAVENISRCLLPSTVDIETCIQNQNEIYISGCKYYSIRFDKIKEYFKFLVEE